MWRQVRAGTGVAMDQASGAHQGMHDEEMTEHVRNDTVMMLLRLSVSQHTRMALSKSEVEMAEGASNDAFIMLLSLSFSRHTCVRVSKSEVETTEGLSNDVVVVL